MHLGKTHHNVRVGTAVKQINGNLQFLVWTSNFESECVRTRAFLQNSSQNGQLAFVEIFLCVASQFSSQIRHPRLEIRQMSHCLDLVDKGYVIEQRYEVIPG